MIYQYERLYPKPTWARRQFPTGMFHFVAAHEQGEVFYSVLKRYRQRVAGKAKAMSPPQDLIQWRTLDMAKSPDLQPNTWQNDSSKTSNAAEAAAHITRLLKNMQKTLGLISEFNLQMLYQTQLLVPGLTIIQVHHELQQALRKRDTCLSGWFALLPSYHKIQYWEMDFPPRPFFPPTLPTSECYFKQFETKKECRKKETD